MILCIIARRAKKKNKMKVSTRVELYEPTQEGKESVALYQLHVTFGRTVVGKGCKWRLPM